MQPLTMNEDREKRKKRFAPKTRTGCRTCRKRHVKCDEGKPFCQRCIRAEIVCEGYYDSKSFPLTPAEEPQSVSPGREPRTKTGSSSPSDSPRSLSPSFGSHEEQRYLCFYVERTAIHAGNWCAPYFWHKILPAAAWSHAALKHCVVAMAMTGEVYSAGAGDKTLRPDGRRAFHYYKAIGLLTKVDAKYPPPTVEMTAIACITFCAFDLANLRPELSTVHLLAASNLISQIESSPRHDTMLVHILKELLTGFEQASSSSRKSTDAGRPILRPSLDACSHFHSNGHARLSLSSCITGIYITATASKPSTPIMTNAFVEEEMKDISQDPLAAERASVIPSCSLQDCLSSLQKWWKTFYLHDSPATDAEREVLKAHYLATKMALDAKLQEAGMLDRLISTREQEERLSEIYAIAQNAAEYRARHPLEEWSDTDGPAMLQRVELERGRMRKIDCCQMAKDFYPQDHDMTSHVSLLNFVIRKTTDEKLREKAESILSARETDPDYGRVPVLWLDHV